MNDEVGRVWPELVAVFQTCLERSEESVTPVRKTTLFFRIQNRGSKHSIENTWKKYVLQFTTPGSRDVADRHRETSS